MSNLTDFAGGGIKSIQRGQTVTTTSTSITIAAVDTNKAFVSSSSNDFNGRGSAVGLTSSTTLLITAPGTTITTYWEVIEYV